jgi:MoxR-like ATPase
MAAKARAVLNGRFHATTSDVKHVAPAVLRHRLVTTFNADASGIKRDDIIRKLLEHVQPPQQVNGRPPHIGIVRAGKLQAIFGKET